MGFLSGIEEELARGDVEVFHEYDSSHFISNAKSAISGKAETVNLDVKLNHYGDMVEKAINNFVNIKIDKDALRTFFEISNKRKLEDDNIFINEIEDANDIIIRLQYLDQYTKIVLETIDKVIKGEITKDSELVQMHMGNLPMKIQKQIVKTSLPYGVDSKTLVKKSTSKIVKVSNNYVTTMVLPFVEKYSTIKDDITTESSNILEAIRETSDKIVSIVTVINNIKTSQSNLPIDRLHLLDQVYYNACRGIIDVISFVSFMIIRKMNIISTNIISCNKLYTDLINIYEGEKNIVEAYDDNFVTNMDNGSMADDLIKGRIEAFQTLAKNIYELHMGIPKVVVGMSSVSKNEYEQPGETTSDVMMDEQDYDKSVYETIAKTYIEVSNGIDRLAARSDDFLMVFDEIIQYAGFMLRLEDRFNHEINKIEDLSEYTGVLNATNASNFNTDVYKRMLAEVKAYPENMQKIADNAMDTFTKINSLNDRYIHNINGEFKDLETINELKIFMKDLIVQYRAYTEIVVGKLLTRLKNIGKIITEMEAKVHDGKDLEYTTYPEPVDIVDYTESVLESVISDITENNKNIFEALQMEFYIMKEKSYKGINVVFEDGEAQNGQNQSGGSQVNNNTNVTVQDNSQQSNSNTSSSSVKSSNSGKTTVQATISKIGDWFRKVIDSFMQMFSKESKKNAEWLKNNKEGLLSRSYNNVTINILPYKNITPETITGDIGKLTNIVNGMTPVIISGIKNKDDMYKKLFPFIRGGINTANPLKDQFVKYYKVGTGNLEVSSISNGELKAEITSTIIPFCESYYSNYINEVKSSLENATSAVDALCDKFASEKTESVSIFEADSSTTGDVSMTEKVNWLKEAIKYYQGSILNAIRDRKNDYFKVLSSLAPKTPKTPAKPVDIKPDHPTNTVTDQQA